RAVLRLPHLSDAAAIHPAASAGERPRNAASRSFLSIGKSQKRHASSRRHALDPAPPPCASGARRQAGAVTGGAHAARSVPGCAAGLAQGPFARLVNDRPTRFARLVHVLAWGELALVIAVALALRFIGERL